MIWCCARCLCCGVECCCGCCSCFNRCCPSPRRSNEGYQQPSAQPYQQYQSHPQPIYGGGGYGYSGPQTATFDSPSNKNGKYNEDALPAMPSWDQAQSRRVEDHDVEMEKLDQHSAQQESLLAQNNAGSVEAGRYYGNEQSHIAQEGSDLGTMHAGPYHDYEAHQQFVGSPVASTRNSAYPPTYQTRPQSSVYGNGYAASIPPSYHTAAPSVASPVQQSMPRRPVQGSWRDV